MDANAFGAEMVALVRDFLEQELDPLRAKLAEIEARISQPAAVEEDDIAAVKSDVESLRVAIAGLPKAPEPPALPDIPTLIADAVSRAVAELPAPKPGEPGKDIDPAAVEEMVAARVAEAVAAIPAADPGKDADPEVIAEMVARAVEALPPAKPGKDADPALVAELVEEKVREAVAALPPAKPGEPGPQGKLPIVREWTDKVHYEGDVRTHGGSTFQALRDTAKEPPHDDWICIAHAGAQGRSFSVRGTYDENETYGHLDVVALGGASFAAKRDNPGACPGDGWQLIAAQGKRGDAQRGKPGDPGKPGPALREVSVDENGVLTFKNADGSTINCDLYPLLSRL